jgi:hypothetical protein
MAPAAMAQKIPSAEAGTAPLVLAPFEAPAPTISVRPGEVAWTEHLVPLYAARLIDPAKPRGRPGADGVPADTLLFGYQLSTGMAYCPPLNPEKSTKRVQCFRDLDNDGKFDAGYVSDGHDADTRYFSSFLHAITGVPKYRYEQVSGAMMTAAPASIIFVGMQDGAPRFRVRIENENLEDIETCEVSEPGVCTAMGVHLRFDPAQQGSLTLTFDGADANRAVGVMNEYDPLKS